MKIHKKDIHFTAEIEMTEAEIQSLVSLFEENCMLRNYHIDEMGGLRKEIYINLKNTLKDN